MPEHIRHNCFVVGVRIIIEAVSARDLHSHGISFEFLNTMCEPGQFGTTIQVKMQKGKATVGHEKFRLPGERIYGRGGKTARRWRAVNSREGGISGSWRPDDSLLGPGKEFGHGLPETKLPTNVFCENSGWAEWSTYVFCLIPFLQVPYVPSFRTFYCVERQGWEWRGTLVRSLRYRNLLPNAQSIITVGAFPEPECKTTYSKCMITSPQKTPILRLAFLPA